MSVLLFGISHHSTPISVLERLSTDASNQAKIVCKIHKLPFIVESMVLFTCNRFEIYVVLSEFKKNISNEILKKVSNYFGIHHNTLSKYSYTYYNETAVEHLFTVVSGLDSAVIGEAQVLGQIRRAYSLAKANNTIGKILNKLIQKALNVGKQVHSETKIASIDVSSVSVVMSLLESKIVGGFKGCTATLIGAGKMSMLSGLHLVQAGIKCIYIVNRSITRAQHLVKILAKKNIHIKAIHTNKLYEALDCTDIIISSTRATHPILSLSDVIFLLSKRHLNYSNQLFVCDLGVPRDIDPAVVELPGISVINIETLQKESSLQTTNTSIETARKIVITQIVKYISNQRVLEITPAVSSLQKYATDIVKSEILRFNNRLPVLDSIHNNEVIIMVQRVVDKLLHLLISRSKQLVRTPEGDKYVKILRELLMFDSKVIKTLLSNELSYVGIDSDKSE